MRFGAPRRLFTSDQGRIGAGVGSPPNEAKKARRQAGLSSGLRGTSCGGACCAWPRLVSRTAEAGTSKDATAVTERGGRPRTRTRTDERPYNTSLLDRGRRENSARSKQKEGERDCQVIGRAVRIIHHRETLYHQEQREPTRSVSRFP